MKVQNRTSMRELRGQIIFLPALMWCHPNFQLSWQSVSAQIQKAPELRTKSGSLQIRLPDKYILLSVRLLPRIQEALKKGIRKATVGRRFFTSVSSILYNICSLSWLLPDASSQSYIQWLVTKDMPTSFQPWQAIKTDLLEITGANTLKCFLYPLDRITFFL